MHPEVVRSEPGSCPICGMALEPRTVVSEERNPELDDMLRRFRLSLALTVPILAFMVSELLPGDPLAAMTGHALRNWIELARHRWSSGAACHSSSGAGHRSSTGT
jgi:Cu+-exporting ATPase